jgi:hypothetical protein
MQFWCQSYWLKAEIQIQFRLLDLEQKFRAGLVCANAAVGNPLEDCSQSMYFLLGNGLAWSRFEVQHMGPLTARCRPQIGMPGLQACAGQHCNEGAVNDRGLPFSPGERA